MNLKILLLVFLFVFCIHESYGQRKETMDIWYEEVGDFIKIFGKNHSKHDKTGHIYFSIDPNGLVDQYSEVFIPKKTEKRLLKTYNISQVSPDQIFNFYYKFWVTGQNDDIELQESYYFDHMLPRFDKKQLSKSELAAFMVEGYELYKDKLVKKALKRFKSQYPTIDSTYAYVFQNIGADPKLVSYKFFEKNLESLFQNAENKNQLLSKFVEHSYYKQKKNKKPEKIREHIELLNYSKTDSTFTIASLEQELDEKWLRYFVDNYLEKYAYDEDNQVILFPHLANIILISQDSNRTKDILQFVQQIDISKIASINAVVVLNLQKYALHNLGHKDRALKINKSTSIFARSNGIEYSEEVYFLLIKMGQLIE